MRTAEAPTMIQNSASTIIRSLLLIAGLAWPGVAFAQSYTISPPPFLTALDNSGNIINGSCIWTYAAGSTTAATTYSDTIGTPNTNPIRSDSAGRFTAYLVAGTNYKFVYEGSCTPPAHGTVLRTADNIAGVPSSAATVDVTGTAGETISAGQCAYLSDGSGAKVAGQWFRCDSTTTYGSLTPEIGVAPSAITSGSSGTIRVAGSVTGLSSLATGSTYYVSTAGAVTATAPGYRRVVGVADSATSLILNTYPTSANWTSVSTTSVGTQNNFDPGISGNTFIRCANASALTITGFPAGYDGQLIYLIADLAQVNLAHVSASSTAGNRLTNFISTTGVNTPLAAPASGSAGGSALYEYVAGLSSWRLIAHEQGPWIAYTPVWTQVSTPPTVDNSVLSGSYYVRGRTVTAKTSFAFGSTTVAGTGAFTFTLPIATGIAGTVIGSAVIKDVSVPTKYTGAPELATTTTFTVNNSDVTTAVGVTQAVPMAWASGDTLTTILTYETQ